MTVTISPGATVRSSIDKALRLSIIFSSRHTCNIPGNLFLRIYSNGIDIVAQVLVRSYRVIFVSFIPIFAPFSVFSAHSTREMRLLASKLLHSARFCSAFILPMLLWTQSGKQRDGRKDISHGTTKRSYTTSKIQCIND